MNLPEFATPLPHKPYWYQEESFVNYTTEAYEGVNRSQLIVMATGLGKSVTAALIARDVIEHRAGRVLVLVHTIDLVDQLVEEFTYWGLPCCVERSERKALQYAAIGTASSKCVVGCVATLKGKRLESWPADYFDLIITDEAHRAPSKGLPAKRRKDGTIKPASEGQYRAIYKHFAKARMLGFTATPNRTDEISLGELFEHKTFEYLLPVAIERGDLAAVELHEVDTGIDLGNIKTIGRGADKDLDPQAIADAIGPYITKLTQVVVFGTPSNPVSYLGPGQTLIFAPDRQSAQAFASAFTSLGIPCAAVDYLTADRAKIIERFKRGTWQEHGEYAALANMGILGVGFNHRPIGNIVNFRATSSYLLLEQFMGRGTRLLSTGEKTRFRFIDFTFKMDADKIARPVDLFLPAGASMLVRDAARKATAATPGSSPAATVASVIAEAEAKAKAEEEARAKREDAKVKAKERQVQVTVKDRTPVKHKSRSFDLFAARQLSGIRMPEPRVGTITMPVTSAARDRLKALGFDSIDGMGQREAEIEIRHWEERRDCGMASLRQCKWLIGQGIPVEKVKAMTSAEAQSVIGPAMAKYKHKSG